MKNHESINLINLQNLKFQSHIWFSIQLTNFHTPHTLLTSASKTKINFFDIFMSGDWWVFEVATTQTLIFWHFQKFKNPFFYHLKKKLMTIYIGWNCTFFHLSAYYVYQKPYKPSEKDPCSLTHLYSSQKVMVVGTTTQQSSTTLLRLLMMMEPVFMTNIKMTPRAPEWRHFDSEILKGN